MKGTVMKTSLAHSRVQTHPNDEIAIHLKKRQAFTIPSNRRCTRLICQGGRLWITQENDPADHILSNGDEFIIPRVGKVVVQGMPQGAFVLIPHP
jgi:hypothetical protein